MFPKVTRANTVGVKKKRKRESGKMDFQRNDGVFCFFNSPPEKDQERIKFLAAAAHHSNIP